MKKIIIVLILFAVIPQTYAFDLFENSPEEKFQSLVAEAFENDILPNLNDCGDDILCVLQMKEKRSEIIGAQKKLKEVNISEKQAIEFLKFYNKSNIEYPTSLRVWRILQKILYNLNNRLINAATKGNMALVKNYLQQGDDVNTTNSVDQNPLRGAILFGKVEVANYLINNGAQFNSCQELKELIVSAEHYISKGALVTDWLQLFNSINNITPFLNNNCPDQLYYLSLIGNSVELLDFFNKLGFELTAEDYQGNNLIFKSISNNASLKVITYLYDSGCALDAINNQGQNIIHIVAKYNNDEVLLFAKGKGIDINHSDKSGKTPLDIAKFNKNYKIIDLLTANKVGEDISTEKVENNNCYLAFDSTVLSLLDFTYKPNGYAWQIYRMGYPYKKRSTFYSLAKYAVERGEGEIDRRDFVAKDKFNMSLWELFRVVCDYRRDIFLDAIEIDSLLNGANRELTNILSQGPSDYPPLPPMKKCNANLAYFNNQFPIFQMSPCSLAYNSSVLDLFNTVIRTDGAGWHIDRMKPLFDDSTVFYKAFRSSQKYDDPTEVSRLNIIAIVKYGKNLHELFRYICEYNQNVFLDSNEVKQLLMVETDRIKRKMLQDKPLGFAPKSKVECNNSIIDEYKIISKKYCKLAFDPNVFALLDFSHNEKIIWLQKRLGPAYDSSSTFYSWAVFYLNQNEMARRERIALERFGLTLHDLFKLVCDYNREYYLDDIEIAEYTKTLKGYKKKNFINNSGPLGNPLKQPKVCSGY